MEGKEGFIFVVETKMYLRSFKKLPDEIQMQARAKIDLFKKYPTHAGLHVHRLNGKHQNKWSFWVNFEYRVIFLVFDGWVALYDIGTHGVYK